MPQVSIKAHFDGKEILLDEPYELPRDAQLLITIVSPTPNQTGLDNWAELSARGLAGAYGDSEPEYSQDDIVSP